MDNASFELCALDNRRLLGYFRNQSYFVSRILYLYTFVSALIIYGQTTECLQGSKPSKDEPDYIYFEKRKTVELFILALSSRIFFSFVLHVLKHLSNKRKLDKKRFLSKKEKK